MSDKDLTSILGTAVPDWQPPPSPFDAGFENGGLIGSHVTLVPLDADLHAAGLYASFAEDEQSTIWNYLPYGPFDTLAEYTDYVRAITATGDVFFFAIQDNEQGALLVLHPIYGLTPQPDRLRLGIFVLPLACRRRLARPRRCF